MGERGSHSLEGKHQRRMGRNRQGYAAGLGPSESHSHMPNPSVCACACACACVTETSIQKEKRREERHDRKEKELRHQAWQCMPLISTPERETERSRRSRVEDHCRIYREKCCLETKGKSKINKPTKTPWREHRYAMFQALNATSHSSFLRAKRHRCHFLERFTV
jgi:hypothetical protein